MSNVNAVPANMLARFFKQWAIFSYDQHRWILLATMAFLALMVSLLSQMQLDMSAEGRLHKSDIVRLQYKCVKRNLWPGRYHCDQCAVQSRPGFRHR